MIHPTPHTPSYPPPTHTPEGKHDPELLAASESFMQEYANVRRKVWSLCKVAQSHSGSPRQRTMDSSCDVRCVLADRCSSYGCHWCRELTVMSSPNTVFRCSQFWFLVFFTTALTYRGVFFKSLHYSTSTLSTILLACQVTQWCFHIINSLLESFEIETKPPPNTSISPALPKDPLLLRIY